MEVVKSEDGTFLYMQEPLPFTQNLMKPWMIRVNNPNKTYWEVVIIILAIYNSFQIPVEIAFRP